LNFLNIFGSASVSCSILYIILKFIKLGFSLVINAGHAYTVGNPAVANEIKFMEFFDNSVNYGKISTSYG